MSNSVRAGLIAFVQSVFPVLILAGVNLSDDAIAGIMLVITNAVTLLALIFPGPKEEVEVVRESVDRADLMRTFRPETHSYPQVRKP